MGRGAVKDTGTLCGRAPRAPASLRVPAHLETRPLGGPAHPTRTCCARARPPSPSRLLPRLLALHTPALLRPPSQRCPPVLCAGRYHWNLRDCPLCARRCAKPGLVQSSQTLRGKRLTAPLPRLSGVWPFARGHADLYTHPDGSHLATELQFLPFTSVTTLGPPNCSGGQNNHTGGWHRDAPTMCQTVGASFHLPEARGIYYSHHTGEERDAEKRCWPPHPGSPTPGPMPQLLGSINPPLY